MSRNPVEDATTEDVYDEQYLINILSEQAELNLKYGSLFVDQSRSAPKEKNKRNKKRQPIEFNRTFENNRDVNKNSNKAKFASNISGEKFKTESKVQNVDSIQNSNLNSNSLPLFKNEMNREYFHWGATVEIMEIIRRKRKSPETLRLVERRLEISRPGTMRRKFDMNAQRQIWVPSRPNKRSREEITEIDGELLSRANRFGGGYQPLEDRILEEEDLNNNNNHQQPEIIEEENEPDSEGESQIERGDNFPIVDFKAYNTEGREAQFIQINQVIEKLTENKMSRKT